MATESVNVLDMIPTARYPAKRSDDGRLIAEVPKFRNAFWRQICRLFRLGENIIVTLDEIGGFVYEHCDGTCNVRGITEKAMAEFGDSIDPAPQRVSEYLKTLERNGMISMRAGDDASA